MTILIPTDFSTQAKNATDYAIRLLNEPGVQFVLLHAWYLNQPASAITMHLQQRMESDNKKLLDEEVARILRTHDVSVDPQLRQGDLTESIEAINKTKPLDLVAMGTKGASGVKEKLFGSNATAVIQAVTCPVLSIPPNMVYEKPCKIAFSADFRKLQNPAALNMLRHLAKRFDAEVKIINILNHGGISSADEAKEAIRLNALLPNVKHSYHFIANPDVNEAIDMFVKQEHTDILAMVTRASSFFDYFFGKSHTKKMALHADIPLLSLHDTK